jgi:hypothetical protein
MIQKNCVLDRTGRVVMGNLPTFGAALAVATTLDKPGCCGPYSAAEAVEIQVDVQQSPARAA